ncbi:MAG: hypothetical protein QOG72_3322, partial [Sphingomonadales bacterium]|nr:hypothetical protein [Sphingomonadales bacterium]
MRALAALLATLFLGSAPTPASAQYEPPKQMTLSPTGVDLTKARFTYKAVDLSIGPLTLERSYLGGPAVEGSSQFGLNWTHNYTTFVIEKNQAKFDGVYVVIGRGVVHFTFTHSGYSCNNPDCDGATLILNGGGAYVYTDAQGNVYTFNPSVKVLASGDSRRSQRIAQVEYADGHSLTYTYSGSQLKQIASNEGYSLVFEYGSSGYISKACGYNRAVNAVTTASTCAGATLAVSYGYAAATWVNLTSVVDVTGQTWGYDYQGTSNVSKMTCLRQVNSSSCLITGNPAPTGGAAYQQTTPDGAVWTYYVSGKDPDENQLPGQPPPISGGGYTGPEGIEVAAQFGAGLLDYYTENGRTTFLQWDGYDLAGLTHPEGNSVGYAYRAGQMISTSWSAKPGSGLATISSGMTLPDLQAPECVSAPPRKICNKPIWREDYNGNRTNYTYDPAHGGVLTETGPAVNPGSGSGAGLVTPQKRFFYVERVAVTAGWEWAGRTIWLLDRTAFCRAGNPNSSNTGCALGASDEVVTSFDYGPTSGPNNLQLRGQAVSADGATLRTCYAYDSLGRKISETSPRGTGGLSACPADPPTQGLPYTASTRYDAAGRVTGTIAPDPDGAGPLPFPALRNSYDTAGRLLKVEKGGLSAWLPETVAPKDWTGFTVLSQSDIQYDAMGRKIGQSTSGGGLVATMTEYGYDLAGRLKCTAVRMNRDAWAYALPDKCVPGPVHPVDGPDRITRNHYDALGQLVRIEKGVGTGLSQVYAAYTYSPNGKPTSVTDANGNRAEMSYDGLDRQKRWIFPSTTAIGEANPADYEEYGYDANASRTSLRKRDGVTISYAYDALGRLTQKTVPTSAT